MLEVLNRSLKKRKADKGFTLIELLVVILIIGILSAIVVVAVRGSTGDAAAKTCTENAANLNNALDRYLTANNDTMPTAGTLGAVTPVNTLPTGVTISSAFKQTELEALLVPTYIKTVPDPEAAKDPVIAVIATKTGNTTPFFAVLCQNANGKNSGI